MSILLVNTHMDSSTATIPVGLLNIGGQLKRHNFDVEYFDISYFLKKNGYDVIQNEKVINIIAKEIMSYNKEIIGFTTRCDTLPKTLHLAKICKKKRNINILLGGVQASLVDLDIIKNFEYIDVIVRGEAEKNITELVKRIKREKALDGIQGITYRDKEGTIHREKDSEILNNLDELANPCYGLLPKDYFEQIKPKTFPIEVGRGCPYNCTFCCTNIYWKKKYRLKSPRIIYNQMQKAYKKYNYNYFSFTHDNLFANKEESMKIIDYLIKKQNNFKWNCNVRIDALDEKIINKLERANCKCMYFGIETGNQNIQNKIKKNIDLSHIDEILQIISKSSIGFIVSFIIGFPNENKKQINDTLTLAIKLATLKNCLEIQIHSLSPMVGSKIYYKNKNNLIFSSKAFSDQVGYNKINHSFENKIIENYPKIFASFYSIKYNYYTSNYIHTTARLSSILINSFQYSLYKLTSEKNIEIREIIDFLSQKIKDYEHPHTDILNHYLDYVINFYDEKNEVWNDIIKYEKLKFQLTLNALSLKRKKYLKKKTYHKKRDFSSKKLKERNFKIFLSNNLKIFKTKNSLKKILNFKNDETTNMKYYTLAINPNNVMKISRCKISLFDYILLKNINDGCYIENLVKNIKTIFNIKEKYMVNKIYFKIEKHINFHNIKVKGDK
ncbi:MAG: B12-binding domain-containing radical SAM protein [Candidatus Mcinerneyibacterium aminivorans]|uniref:B12-binding domain-containing radical SAM protein n=1 Tax=Candidatus Mcinerneyibacterium aminivorans TaxID=2703815 RepID=A0A5D0MFN7_9BACT|nr:MAG: B12-binding domain-containing radical SAM protein [Candidatus Mcinerneyibacterium aminivorans]